MIRSALDRFALKLYVFAFILGISYGFWGFLPIFLLDLGGTVFQLGLLSTLPGLISTFMHLAWGRAIDQLGYNRRMITRGFLLSFIFSIFIIFSKSPWYLIVVTALLVLFESILPIATDLMLSNAIESNYRVRFMSFYNPIANAGNISGSFIAGLLIPLIGYPSLFLIYSFLCLIIFIFTTLSITDKNSKSAFKYLHLFHVSLKELFIGIKELPAVWHMGGTYTRWVVGMSIRGLGIATFSSVLNYYVVRVLNASSSQIGSLNALSAAVNLFSSSPLGCSAIQVIISRIGIKDLMLLGVAMASGFPLLCILASDVVQLLPAYVLNGVFWGCINAVFFTWQMNLIPKQKGTYMGLLNFINGGAWVLGSFFGGIISNYFGIVLTAIISSCITFLGLLILFNVPEKSKL